MAKNHVWFQIELMYNMTIICYTITCVDSFVSNCPFFIDANAEYISW